MTCMIVATADTDALQCEDGPPCRQCLDLDLPCTFERPSRRRGPRNKCAEAIKKRKREDSSDPGFTTSPSPSPHESDVFIPSSVEAICSFPVLSRVLNDYFAYLHPLMPFPHERTFRQTLNARNLQTRSFVPLVASMVGAVVVSSPPKARMDLKMLSEERLSRHGLNDSAERYHELAVKARGLGFLDRSPSVDDAATSYFLGFINAKLSKWRQAELYFGECQNILRTLGFHKAVESVLSPQGSLASSASSEQRSTLDHVAQETGRRIFWTMYMAASSTPALETFFAESIASTHVVMSQFPPLPTEADDAYIFPHHIVPPAAGSIPKMVGFNALARIVFAKNASNTSSSLSGTGNFDWNNQRQNIKQSLFKCANIFNSLPLVLQIRSDASTTPFPWDAFFETPRLDSPTAEYGAQDPRGNLRGSVTSDPLESLDRQRLVLDILKAEIFVSYLEAGSSLIDRSISLDECIDATTRVGNVSNAAFTPATTMAPFEHTYMPQGMCVAGQDMVPNFSPPMSSKFDYLPPTTPARTPDWNESNVWTQREEIARELLSVFGGLGRLNIQMGRAGTDLVRLMVATTRCKYGLTASRLQSYGTLPRHS